MSRDIFAGVLETLGKRHQEDQQNLLTQEMARRKNLAEFWRTQLDDEQLRPEARDVATNKYMTIIQTPFDKKLPKGIEALDDFLQVHPRIGGTIPRKQQQSEGFETTTGSDSPAGAHNEVPMQIDPYEMEAPTPPPGYTMPARYTQQEREQAASNAAYEKSNMDVRTAGRKAYAEAAAKQSVEDSPEALAAFQQRERAKRPNVVLGPDDLLVGSEMGNVVAQGLPKPAPAKTAEMLKMDTAAGTVAQRHGLQVTSFEQLPTPSLKTEALLEMASFGDTADEKEIKRLEKIHQQQLNTETNLRIQQLRESDDPAKWDEMADIVNQNPDQLFSNSSKDQGLIRDAMRRKGYPIPNKAVEGPLKTQESNSKLVLKHTAVIRDILAKYPEIIGPVAGRWGLTEEKFGSSLPWSGRSGNPEESKRAQAAQELRTRLKYLNAQDLRALVGARPPFQWLEELKDTSPNVKMVMDLMLGSLNAVEGSSNLVLDTAWETRYGTQLAAPNAPPGRPQPVPGAVTPGAVPAPVPPPTTGGGSRGGGARGAGARGGPAATPGMVRMQLDGVIYDVPQANVAAAKKRGAVEVK